MTPSTPQRSWLAKHRHMSGKHISLLSAVLLFGVIGSISLLAAKATTPTASLEAESGTPTANISSLSDSTASGVAAIKFGIATAPGSCATTKRAVTSQEVSANTNSGYSAGTQLYVPGGPDPWGGCFPNASNTGYPAGSQLTNYTDSCTITTPNITITNKNITCEIHVQAANVTITKSKITAGNLDIDSGSLTLSDSEVNLGNNPIDEGIKGSNYTILRTNMYGGKREVYCSSNCTIQDSFLHDQLTDPGGTTHESAARVEQFTTLRHNTLLCNAPDIAPDAGCSANQTGYPDFATVHDNTFDKNLYMATSGGYCSYGGASNGKPFSDDPQNATNIHSTNNVFQRGTRANDRTTLALSDKRRYTCGGYGVTTSFASAKAGFVFSGNMWDDGLLFASDSSYPYGSFVE